MASEYMQGLQRVCAVTQNSPRSSPEATKVSRIDTNGLRTHTIYSEWTPNASVVLKNGLSEAETHPEWIMNERRARVNHSEWSQNARNKLRIHSESRRHSQDAFRIGAMYSERAQESVGMVLRMDAYRTQSTHNGPRVRGRHSEWMQILDWTRNVEVAHPQRSEWAQNISKAFKKEFRNARGPQNGLGILFKKKKKKRIQSEVTHSE
jgi:hypothetical protein